MAHTCVLCSSRQESCSSHPRRSWLPAQPSCYTPNLGARRLPAPLCTHLPEAVPEPSAQLVLGSKGCAGSLCRSQTALELGRQGAFGAHMWTRTCSGSPLGRVGSEAPALCP